MIACALSGIRRKTSQYAKKAEGLLCSLIDKLTECFINLMGGQLSQVMNDIEFTKQIYYLFEFVRN